MVKNGVIYDQLIDITEDYLGPAAERFIDRQIESHLDKHPGKLTREDLKKLTEWIRLSVAILTDDEKIIDGLTLKLRELSVNNSGG
ncbi:hypothetical protein KY385_03460 [Candidatus Parcubacteria bacterium]|nr:hypothetical protein [Candidatus Parcubacteria bacterium]